MTSVRRAARTIQTRALLLRRVPFGDADLVLQLLTEDTGKVSALARAARKSQKRFGGALEPFHTLQVRLDERAGQELMNLREASLDRPRRRILSTLERLDAAGRVLGWVRRAAPPLVREDGIWTTATELLDSLELPSVSVDREVATAGLRLLAACGWGLEFDACVVCGRACRAGRAAFIDAARGGLVCQSCGSARIHVDGSQRERLRSAALGLPAALDTADAALALDLVEAALRAHLGFE